MNPTKKLRAIVGIVMLGFHAVADAGPVFGPPQERTFTKTTVIEYTRREYDPVLTLARAAGAQGGPDSPDLLAARQLSAMRDGDFEAWVATWDAETQESIRDRVAGGELDPAQLRATWAVRFKNAETRITSWIEFSMYVVIVHEVAREGEPIVLGEVVTIPTGQGWRATEILDDHPVLNALRTGVTEIEQRIP